MAKGWDSRSLIRGLAAPAAAVAAVLLLVPLFCAALGVSPALVLRTLSSRFGPEAWGQVLYKSCFLLFTGLSVALAFRAGLFNIGAEGQMVLGALSCALVALWLGEAPAFVVLPASVLAAALGGGLWGLLPGLFKARWGRMKS